MYFYLCRTLLDFAWDRVSESPEMDETELTNRLHEHAGWWLANGRIDDDPMSPATIIETERRLIPLTSEGDHLDCDCPICRMEADGTLGFGPTFETFDGHHLELDEKFVFSLSKTREDWEFTVVGPVDAEPDALPSTVDAGSTPAAGETWTSSYISPTAPLSLLTLAMCVAELIEDVI